MSFNKVTVAQLSLSICSKRTALPAPLPSAVFQRFMLRLTESTEALELRFPFSEWSVGLKPRALVKGVNDTQLCPLTSTTLKMLQSRHIIFQISMTLSKAREWRIFFFWNTNRERHGITCHKLCPNLDKSAVKPLRWQALRKPTKFPIRFCIHILKYDWKLNFFEENKWKKAQN